jgi:Response regulator containing CheY-like receiver domain and AraC-type DNA-binding domain
VSDLNCLRVLYVEDDEATREALSRFLKIRVGKLCPASSGEEGLQKFNEFRPNLLIVDLILPGMSGLEMIGEIRRGNRGCRVMITSSVNELSTVLEAVDLGIDHYIVKPIDMEDLVKKMEGVAEGILRSETKSNAVNFTYLENSGMIEDLIRRDFLRIQKNFAGKGPQDVKVLLFENKVEITAVEGATMMEKTVIANRRNLSMMEQFRRLFYEEISQKLEECVEQATGYKVKMTSLIVDGAKRVDKITLTVI